MAKARWISLGVLAVAVTNRTPEARDKSGLHRIKSICKYDGDRVGRLLCG
jgi:hypothetical protein